jgi:hypothetical protein
MSKVYTSKDLVTDRTLEHTKFCVDWLRKLDICSVWQRLDTTWQPDL